MHKKGKIMLNAVFIAMVAINGDPNQIGTQGPFIFDNLRSCIEYMDAEYPNAKTTHADAESVSKSNGAFKLICSESKIYTY